MKLTLPNTFVARGRDRWRGPLVYATRTAVDTEFDCASSCHRTLVVGGGSEQVKQQRKVDFIGLSEIPQTQVINRLSCESDDSCFSLCRHGVALMRFVCFDVFNPLQQRGN